VSGDRSRWLVLPPGVRELEPDLLAAGFQAAGVAAGIKRSGKEDVGLLYCEREGATSALFTTRNAAAAAPVQLVRSRCDAARLRAVAVNSGCANAATGERGLADALQMQEHASGLLGLPASQVAVCSTGTIGDPLPVERVVAGLGAAAAALAPGTSATFQRAIETTDAFPKQAALAVSLAGGEAVLSAQCKGAGMIAPRLATMLCFVQTDAAVAADRLALACARALGFSFERISVDGQLSTNDTVVAIASGAGGVSLVDEQDQLAFEQALGALLRKLALLVVKDGEGARRVARVVVEAPLEEQAWAVAQAVGNSPLVKAALFGGDPNWGRILQAAGATLEDPALLARLEISIEGVTVCREGAAVPFDREALAAAVGGEEVEYALRVGEGGAASAELFFSDLSYEYVRINAEYTT